MISSVVICKKMISLLRAGEYAASASRWVRRNAEAEGMGYNRTAVKTHTPFVRFEQQGTQR